MDKLSLNFRQIFSSKRLCSDSISYQLKLKVTVEGHEFEPLLCVRFISKFKAIVKGFSLEYVLKKVIRWKQIMLQRTETRVCKLSGPV